MVQTVLLGEGQKPRAAKVKGAWFDRYLQQFSVYEPRRFLHFRTGNGKTARVRARVCELVGIGPDCLEPAPTYPLTTCHWSDQPQDLIRERELAWPTEARVS